MTRIWSVDENNDLFTLPGGRLAISDDLQAVLQQAEHAVKAQLNEMIYDDNRGIDYESLLFGGSPNPLGFEAAIRDTLEAIPDVISVLEFDTEQVGSEFRYTATLHTLFGTGPVSNIIDTGTGLRDIQGVGINGRL